MGSKKKAGSKKKRLEAQKVKLKVGRRLTQSNMTSTAFKSGRIVLPDQIPQFRALGPETDRQQFLLENSAILEDMLRDSIGKLMHFNSAVRYKAICWLRKTLLSKSSFIAEHLHEILQKTLLLLRDSDDVVRQVTRQLTGQMVTRLSEAQFEPHWPLLAKHLACIFSTSSDVNLHSEIVGLLRQVAPSRPRALIAHCTSVVGAFITRLSNLPAASLVPYLTVNVGDGSLAAIAKSICSSGSITGSKRNSNAEATVIERILSLLSDLREAGARLLSSQEKLASLSVSATSNVSMVTACSNVTVFRDSQIFCPTATCLLASPIYVLVPSPLANGLRLQLPQASRDGATAPCTFQEKLSEIAHLVDVVEQLKS